MSERIWNVGLQQFEIICCECKNKIIEDEVSWFNTDDGLICEDCYRKKKIKRTRNNTGEV